MPYTDKEKRRQYHATYRAKNPEKLRQLGIEYRKRNKDRVDAQHRNDYVMRKERYKNSIFELLGNKCNRCPNTDIRVLQIHHPERDGHVDREGGIRDIAYIKKMLTNILTYGTGRYELLCANCHLIEHYEDQRVKIVPIPPKRNKMDRSLCCYSRKLIPEQVKQIKQEYKSNPKIITIAKKYNVSYSTILNIVRGKTWQWVE